MPKQYSLRQKDAKFDNREPSYVSTNEVSSFDSIDPPAYSVTTNSSIQLNTVKHNEKKTTPSTHSDDGSEDAGKTKKDKKEKLPMVGITETFRFATVTDKLLMVFGTLCACAHGAGLPLCIVIFGNMSDLFIDVGSFDNYLNEYVPVWLERCLNMTSDIPGDQCENVTVEHIKDDPSPPQRLVETCVALLFPPGCDQLNDTQIEGPIPTLQEEMAVYSIWYCVLGACVLVVAYVQVIGWQTAAFNQSQRIRNKLFVSILRQEISWFDTHEVGELNTRLSDDVTKIELGIGDKLGLFVQYTSAFVTGIVIGFVYSWKLTLVILAVSPLIALSGMAMSKLGSNLTSKELLAYAKAGAIAEEVFSAIRTVMAFGGEDKEYNRYNSNLSRARDLGIKKGLVNGLAMGMVYFVMFGSYALGFWYGSELVFGEELSPGNLLTVFFCVLIGTFSLGNAAPNIQNFAVARGAAYAIYGIIDCEPHIDSTSEEGIKSSNIQGNVGFQNVHFNYPSRPEVKVLQGLSMEIPVGRTVALVGASGCGKSTTVQLLQRFYDAGEGTITLDGTDIRDYNVKWLRQQIGVVSQEPVLFATSIAENIRYGYDGVTDDDITEACIKANAHDFVTKLPNQYGTLVGERGAQLSGGQKQRIAIARALVRNPKILLLDEATSALDTESEATVQAALDAAREGRTTIVIAHRLSTIKTADVIIGIENGKIIEQGTHEKLMAHKGLYHELVMNQNMQDESDITDTTSIPLKPGLDRAISTTASLKRGMSHMSDDSTPSEASSKTEEKEKLPKPELKRIIRLNAPEWYLVVLGCFSAAVVGCVEPFFAILFAEILGTFAEDTEEAHDTINLYAGMFAVIGTIAAIAMVVMNVCFSRAGEYLTLRLRQLSFKALLRQEMAFFDDHNNNVGALCTRLATDTSAVQGATGARLGMVCQAFAGIGAGIIIGFVFSWELTLLIVGFAPLVLISGFLQMKVMSGNQESNKEIMEQAGKVAIEAIENIRTVATLTREPTFAKDYQTETTKPHKINKKKAHVQAGGYAFSQGILFFAYAACFQFGAFLIENRGLKFDDMYKVFGAIVFGAMSAGEATSFTPNYTKAKTSAARIFSLLDRTTAIDSANTSGKKPTSCKGNIKLIDVHFNYPSRPNVTVLRGLGLHVTPGQTVALVGSSGCGKSTTVQLLERFYDPLDGQVTVEDENLSELNIRWLRSQMGIVSQEPVLFDCSIRENIAYGDNSREVPMSEIIEAAKNANIHNFIDNLPEAYDTNVGDKGTQLSGGQKQRVAIARALVRNPKILLLDEATSALDTESEKVVQAALDRAQEGRTCIVIAHRLSTIQNADNIVVIHHGKVVEMGTHSELLQQRGRYYKLNNTQLSRK